MQKKLLTVISSLMAVVVLSAFSASPVSLSVKTLQPAQNGEATVVLSSSAENNNALESRFLNMLNHSYVYNEAFYSDEDLVNNSIIALLNLRDKEYDSYISEVYVRDYIFNMYGKIYTDFSSFNTEFPQREGYVYIVPRGFTDYSHSIVSVTDNNDGSYTVVTAVVCSSHDDADETLYATTYFIENPESDFGYNILYSEITENTVGFTVC